MRSMWYACTNNNFRLRHFRPTCVVRGGGLYATLLPSTSQRYQKVIAGGLGLTNEHKLLVVVAPREGRTAPVSLQLHVHL